MAPVDPRHYPLGPLRWRHDDGWMIQSRALLGLDTGLVKRAAIFVHGFHGSACETWDAFPEQARSMLGSESVDFFFWGYPSIDRAAAFCGLKLQEFLFDILRSPAPDVINLSLPQDETPRPKSFAYERIVLVAHSMGAAVSRRALLNLQRDGMLPAESNKFRLLLFAPAHVGSNLPLLIESGLGIERLPGSKLLANALVIHYRSLTDLSKGSDFLVQLTGDNIAARGAGSAATDPQWLRAFVYQADRDKVVLQDRFDDDVDAVPVMRQNHRTVCKPDCEFDMPMKGVEAMLFRTTVTKADLR